MPIPALLTLAALVQPPIRPPVKPAAAEIVVTDTAISLPGLPQSVEQAHAGNKVVKLQLTHARQALEQHLKDLQRTLDGHSCPTSIKVPKDRESDLRFLLSVLKDDSYQMLEKSFLKAWDDWHSSLINQGLATTVESRAMTGEERYEPMPDPRDRRSEAFKNQRLDPFCLLSATRPAINGGSAVDWDAYARLLDEKLFFRKRVVRAIQIRVVADKAAPDLAKSWAPLTSHLNECARRLAGLEQAPLLIEPAEHRLLRLYANKALMERMLLAAWLCNVVWAEMTSEALPPPPKLAD